MLYWAIFCRVYPTVTKKPDTFVVPNSFGKGAFAFGFAVIAPAHFGNKLTFFSAGVFLLASVVPPTSF